MASPSRTLRRRAVPILVSTLVALGLLHALGSAAVPDADWFRDPLLGNQLRQFEARLAGTSGTPYLVVALGSSRTLNGFRGDVAEPLLEARVGRPVLAQNLAVPGGGPLNAYLAWRRLRDRGVQPDLVFLEFSSITTPRKSRPEWSEQIPAARLSSAEQQLLADLGNPPPKATWGDSLTPAWFTYRKELLSLYAQVVRTKEANDGRVHTDPWGTFRIRSEASSEMRSRALNRARRSYQSALAVLAPTPFAEPGLARLLTELRDAGATVVLVRYPEGPVMRGWYTPASRAILNGLLDRVTPHAAGVVDAWEWLGEEAFMDSHHLLEESAADFTRRLVAAPAPF